MSYTIVYNMPGCLPEMDPYEVEGTLADAVQAVGDEVARMADEDEGERGEAWDELLTTITRDQRGSASLWVGGVTYEMPNGYVIEATLTQDSQ